jgi:undecaprenyl-diphosphatase
MKLLHFFKGACHMVFMQAIILGLVQGLTEFIPISSSAHLVIIPWLFSWNNAAIDSLTFDVALHMGTLFALLVFFRSDWIRIVRAGCASIAERKIGDDVDRRMAWYLVIGSIPGALIGAAAEHKIEKLFHTPNMPIQPHAIIVMGIIIAVFAVVMLMAERLVRHTRDIKGVSFKDALIIGCAQALAVFPGVSRSGATITAGLALGFQREAAARFSFLLSTPIIAGAGAKSLFKVYKEFHTGALTHADFMLFPIGVVVAAISGFFCIKFLLKFLQKNSTAVFAYYRWVLAAVVIIVALTRG